MPDVDKQMNCNVRFKSAGEIDMRIKYEGTVASQIQKLEDIIDIQVNLGNKSGFLLTEHIIRLWRIFYF